MNKYSFVLFILNFIFLFSQKQDLENDKMVNSKIVNVLT